MNRALKALFATVFAACLMPLGVFAYDDSGTPRMIAEQVIYPSALILVQSKNNTANMTGVGSGTVVYSPTDDAVAKCRAARATINMDDAICRNPLILTVYHNFVPVPGKDTGERTPGLSERPDIQPSMFDAGVVLALPDMEMMGRGMKTVPAPVTVVAYDKKRDLALIRVHVEDTLPYVARLASKETKLGLGSTVWASGFPQGMGPHVTAGILSNSSESCEKTNVGRACKLLVLSSNTFAFGISGGGLYQLSDKGFEYIAMPSGMGPLAQIALSTHVLEIHTFLEENGFGFLIPESKPAS